MLLERYKYEISSSFLQYDFYSEGPKGRIKKVVFYSFLGIREGIDYYNLGFGDYDYRGQTINDLSVSNNGDRDKILATVAFTALEFSTHFPYCAIIAGGSTPARTRLYQMGIAKFYREINVLFDIQGLKEGNGWVAFKPGENYIAFLINRK